jgi:hypothetical protein
MLERQKSPNRETEGSEEQRSSGRNFIKSAWGKSFALSSCALCVLSLCKVV